MVRIAKDNTTAHGFKIVAVRFGGLEGDSQTVPRAELQAASWAAEDSGPNNAEIVIDASYVVNGLSLGSSQNEESQLKPQHGLKRKHVDLWSQLEQHIQSEHTGKLSVRKVTSHQDVKGWQPGTAAWHIYANAAADELVEIAAGTAGPVDSEVSKVSGVDKKCIQILRRISVIEMHSLASSRAGFCPKDRIPKPKISFDERIRKIVVDSKHQLMWTAGRLKCVECLFTKGHTQLVPWLRCNPCQGQRIEGSAVRFSQMAPKKVIHSGSHSAPVEGSNRLMRMVRALTPVLANACGPAPFPLPLPLSPRSRPFPRRGPRPLFPSVPPPFPPPFLCSPPPPPRVLPFHPPPLSTKGWRPAVLPHWTAWCTAPIVHSITAV